MKGWAGSGVGSADIACSSGEGTTNDARRSQVEIAASDQRLRVIARMRRRRAVREGVSSLSLLSGGLSSLSCLRGCGGLGSISGLGEGGGAILSAILAARVDA